MLDGIDVVILVIGFFAVGETLHQAWRHGRDQEEVLTLTEFTGMSREDWRRSWKAWLRGTAIGFPLGVLPCGGSVIPTFLSYMVEKRLSDDPERFGNGAIEGVAGPEAANNAAAAGVLVPLLTLGLPSSATAAVMLAAFQQYGLQPGPLLFEARPDLVWTLIASLYIGNTMLLVLNLPLVCAGARDADSTAAPLPRSWCWRRSVPTASTDRLSTCCCLRGRHLRRGDAGGAGAAVPAVIGLILGPPRTAVSPRDGDRRGRPVGVRHAADQRDAARRRGSGPGAAPAARAICEGRHASRWGQVMTKKSDSGAHAWRVTIRAAGCCMRGTHLVVVASGIMISGLGLVAMRAQQRSSPAEVMVYKSATCGCCASWVEHLKAHCFALEVQNLDDARMLVVAKEVGVADQLGSCHTAKVSGYVVVGHVPAADIQRMLKERPAIVGLSAPGMPIGSPGMEQGGRKDPYDVIAFAKDGKRSVYAKH